MSYSSGNAAAGNEVVCNYCGTPAAKLRCGGCSQVHYCSRDHQKADWKGHKAACLYYQGNKSSAGNMDKVVPKGEYVGTLRWGPDTKFMKLPPFDVTMAPPLTGWNEYFSMRLIPSEADCSEEKFVVEPPLIDGLSFPVTFLWALKSLIVSKSISMSELRRKTMVIGVLGASERAEERLLADSNYWQEIGNSFPGSSIELWLVGPEVSRERHNKAVKLTSNMTCKCVRGTTGDFLDQCGDRDPILVGFNTGFGSGDDRLRASWLVDLQRILKLGVLAIFTCANDHGDLKGEREILEKRLKAKYVLYPRRSPFAAVTTTHAPGRQEDTWACANSFVYAIQGSVEVNQVAPLKNALPTKKSMVAPPKAKEAKQSAAQAMQGPKEVVQKKLANSTEDAAQTNIASAKRAPDVTASNLKPSAVEQSRIPPPSPEAAPVASEAATAPPKHDERPANGLAAHCNVETLQKFTELSVNGNGKSTMSISNEVSPATDAKVDEYDMEELD